MTEKQIKLLMKLSDKAFKKNEVPISAIIINGNKIVSKAYNKRNKTNQTLDHAEIIAIKKANKKMKSWRLNECSLLVTFEPCEMCREVIKEARIKEVIYLIDRDERKKNHDKTTFQKCKIEDYETTKKEYLKKVSLFWKLKRKE